MRGDCDQISSSWRLVKVRLEVHLETSRKPANIKVPLRGRLSRAPPTTVQKEQGTTVVER